MTSLPPESSGVRFPPPFVYLAGLALGWVQATFWRIAFLPGTVRWAFGAVLISCWLLLTASSIALFSRRKTSINPTVPTAALVVDGPYRFTRNPMYLGLACAQAGAALLMESWLGLMLLVPALWIIRTQVIAREERYLETKFGDAYRQYRERVGRWL